MRARWRAHQLLVEAIALYCGGHGARAPLPTLRCCKRWRKKVFAFLIHAPQGGLIIAPVLFDEGPLSRSDPLSGQSESWPDRGAPEWSTARWLVERWEALRLALGARGHLAARGGSIDPPPRGA